MNENNKFPNFMSVLNKYPQAYTNLVGDSNHPNLSGTVKFFQTNYGVIIITQVMGLPSSENMCNQPIFGFHIHEGNSCTGNQEDQFADAGMHYNPNNCLHPYHAGDLPPLFSNNQMAFSINLLNRFTVNEIIGKTIIIHAQPDDFTTQPSGNIGNKIACGEIKAFQTPLSMMFRKKY